MIQLLIPFPVPFLFLFLFCCTLTAAAQPLAAAPALSVPSAPTTVAASPAPTGPDSVISILKKDGRFGVFIKLLQSTKVADNLDSQLVDSSNGLTVFAPTDSAFSNLKTGTLNSFTDEQKTELVQFHVLTSHISPSQFQTASNPLRTQAGGSTELLAMNVTLPPPPPPPPPPPKTPSPKASPVYVAPVDSSTNKCLSEKKALYATACFMLVLAAFP